MITRNRLVFAALLLAVLAFTGPIAQAQDHAPAPAAAPQHDAAAQHEASATHDAAAQHAAAVTHDGAEAPHDPGWWPTIWKAANFVILVGVLVYFLRAPLAAYLAGRIAKVREDLVTAAQTRDAAARQLADIDARLAALPAELQALKERGAEDLVAERARIEQDAQAERQRLLEQTRRDIDMRLRIAKRELLEVAAGLAVTVASARIRASITADDQARLVTQYASQLASGADRGREGARQ